jgi:tripartite-type tricarboxylate transporter receptor subunit TctC
MKKIIVAATMIWSSLCAAQEKITIVSPYAASHSGNAAMFKIIEQANAMQNKFDFVLEFRPGGEQLIAIKAIERDPQKNLVVIAPKFVEHAMSGNIQANQYVPVHALGDACWAIIANINNGKDGIANLQNQKEIFVGGVGIGNATHLTSLQIAEKYGFAVQYVPFKSNYDALIVMAANGGINFVIDRVTAYQQFRTKNPNLVMLAMHCPDRHPQAPHVATLKEQGITAPYVFNITMAHVDMKPERRAELGQILNSAASAVGTATIQQLSDMRPPVMSLDQYFKDSYALVEQLLKKHHKKLH